MLLRVSNLQGAHPQVNKNIICLFIFCHQLVQQYVYTMVCSLSAHSIILRLLCYPPAWKDYMITLTIEQRFSPGLSVEGGWVIMSFPQNKYRQKSLLTAQATVPHSKKLIFQAAFRCLKYYTNKYNLTKLYKSPRCCLQYRQRLYT